jgi:hypothetical protein
VLQVKDIGWKKCLVNIILMQNFFVVVKLPLNYNSTIKVDESDERDSYHDWHI